MLNRLLNNLHPGINKDPQTVPAITITANGGTAVIQNNILQLTGPSSAQYNLQSYTLGSLVQAINQQSGFSAILTQPPQLAAIVLMSGTYSMPASIPMFTSFLWQLLKPVALALADAVGAENRSILEMVLNTSDGAWLDSFGELFGIYRQDGEPDQLYALRIFDLTVAPRVNNLAIQKSLRELGYDATVTDAETPYTFNVVVNVPVIGNVGFFYSYPQVVDFVQLLKAAGTIAIVILQYAVSDSAEIVDDISLLTVVPGTGQLWGSGSKWGQGHWYPPTQYNPPSFLLKKYNESVSISISVTASAMALAKWGSRKWGQGTYQR